MLALNTEVSLVVDEIGDIDPLESLGLLSIASPDTDASEAGSQQHLGTFLVLAEETLLRTRNMRQAGRVTERWTCP